MTAPIGSTADLRGQRTVVLGLARSGAAAARMLSDAGARVTIYDRRPASDLADAVAGLGERPIDLALAAPEADVRVLLASADLVVTSPSISARFPTTDEWLRDALRQTESRGTPVIGEVDLFLRLTRSRVLAVTGTKGKTTTTALIGAILATGEVPHLVGGNIGTPLIEQVDQLGPHDWAVLELSELQLPTISRGADVAVYTNIGSDHLDRHGSVEAYREVKARLARLTVTRGTVVLNADDPGCRELGASLTGDVRHYGLDDRSLAASADEAEIYLAGEPLMPVAEVPLPGRHMLSNVLAAAAGATLAGATRDAVATGIRGFAGVPHRLETVAERNGVRWVNDSQATIPMATIAALEAFGTSPIILIAGGRGKGLDYGELADAIAARAKAAILIGETADALAGLVGGRTAVQRAASMEEAVERAAGQAQPGDTVLLSPAAASFDMFTDYAARGEAFRAAVAALP
ncbi:MAG TPA: UDP-N-acetylmuramoyl-L-alanine--D-glutamate ligase, partial [Candidatus Limnocylindria bacterium]|nr:UDP-N-acetylmuramoyl-L-alanine--D-glutamate ligase [Candidatus Limnocylindria bacterium]